MTHPYWPVWGIRIRTPRLELRPVREAEMADLVELAGRGIHDPDTMPFLVPWTDLPSPGRERASTSFYLGCWAEWLPERWRLPLAAYRGDECVGQQDLCAVDFGVLRTVETGSWLGRAHQGRGLGTEMRAGALPLAFDHVGARRAETGAFEDNAASLGVTTSLGYRPNGDRLRRRRDGWGRERCFVMEEAEWERSAARTVRVEVDGVDAAVLAQLGAV
jgi:RimJ/RimL family protein N-acetyltransferase